MTAEASDPRVASIVRELRRISPELQVQVLAEVLRAHGGAVTFRVREILAGPGGPIELLEHANGERFAAHLMLSQGESGVRWELGWPQRGQHYPARIIVRCLRCDGEGVVRATDSGPFICSACQRRSAAPAPDDVLPQPPIPAGTPIVMELGRGFRPARPGEQPDAVARHVHPACCQACGAFRGAHAAGCPLSATG